MSDDRSKPAGPAENVANYSAPALEKGLDILELLSEEVDSLSQQNIALRLNRSANEIYRMLTVLDRRGYLNRGSDGTYGLSLKLFELSHRHPPVKRLLTAGLPRIQQLTRDTRQAAHLAIYYDRRVFVIAQVDSPEPMGFNVRMGTNFPVRRDRTSAWVLTAFQNGPIQAEMMEEMLANSDPPMDEAELHAALETIIANGVYEAPSFTTTGIDDISCPIRDFTGMAIAALTVPFLKQRYVTVSYAEARQHAMDCANVISRSLGWIDG